MPLPSQMQQIVFEGAGGPEVIRIVPGPVPGLAPGKVLIEVVAFALNRGDCMLRAGTLPSPPGPQQAPGLEVSGRIVAVGENVTNLRIGDEVCALVGTGAYAEFCIAQAALCFPRPKAMSLVDSAALPEVNFVVYDDVFRRARLKPGESLLVHGGSGGIGSTAIQLAKYFGATVFTTAGSERKCSFCKDMGADHVIDYTTQDYVTEVDAITAGKGVDVILDFVGGDYIKRNLSILAIEGRHYSIMFMQGSIVRDLDLMPIMLKRQTIMASALRLQSPELQAQVATELVERVWPAYDSGEIKPKIGAVFPMADTRGAHELMETSEHLGKIVVTTGR